MVASSASWLDEWGHLRRLVGVGQILADVLALGDPQRLQGDPDRLEARDVVAVLAGALGIAYEPSVEFDDATVVELVLSCVAPDLERDLRSGGALAGGEEHHWDDVAFNALRSLTFIDDLHEFIMATGSGDIHVASPVDHLRDQLEVIARSVLAERLRRRTDQWKVKEAASAGRKARLARVRTDRARSLR